MIMDQQPLSRELVNSGKDIFIRKGNEYMKVLNLRWKGHSLRFVGNLVADRLAIIELEPGSMIYVERARFPEPPPPQKIANRTRPLPVGWGIINAN